MDFAGGTVECFRRILLEHVKLATLRAFIATLDHFNACAFGLNWVLSHDNTLIAIAAQVAISATNSARLTSSAAALSIGRLPF